jgi:hypothetical protein
MCVIPRIFPSLISDTEDIEGVWGHSGLFSEVV